MNASKKGMGIEKQKGLYQKLLLVYWKEELNSLVRKTGISIEDVSAYMGLHYKRDIGFYAKLPQKRSTLIGIGMAFKLSVDDINRWLTHYAKKNRLYSKDVFSDLIWIYLINCNYKDRESDINYYRLYDRCVAAASATYEEFFRENMIRDQGTGTVAEELSELDFDEEFNGLRGFVIDHIDAFRTAYTKPRQILEKYVKAILGTLAESNGKESTLSSLRGYLDDSMINYLSGKSDTLHAVDLSSGRITSHLKILPRSRKEHIAICLALGMITDEINNYLSVTGYTELDSNEAEERALIIALDMWDDVHPLPKQYKAKYILEDKSAVMEHDDEFTAAEEMLQMRQSLKDEYRRKNERFPYIND